MVVDLNFRRFSTPRSPPPSLPWSVLPIAAACRKNSTKLRSKRLKKKIVELKSTLAEWSHWVRAKLSQGSNPCSESQSADLFPCQPSLMANIIFFPPPSAPAGIQIHISIVGPLDRCSTDWATVPRRECSFNMASYSTQNEPKWIPGWFYKAKVWPNISCFAWVLFENRW